MVDYLFENDWSMGVAGLALSAANSAGTVGGSTTSLNDAITSLAGSNGSSVNFSNFYTHRNRGCSLRIIYGPTGTAGAGYVVLTPRALSTTRARFVTRGYFTLDPADSGAGMRLAEYRDASVATFASFGLATANSAFTAYDNNSNTGVNVNSGIVPTAGVEYRWEVAYTVGSGSSDGVIELNIYLGDSMTPLYSGSASNANLGTSTPTTVRLGNSGNLANRIFYFGPVRIEERATGFVGTDRPRKSLRVEVSDGVGGTTPGYLTYMDSTGVEQAITYLEVKP